MEDLGCEESAPLHALTSVLKFLKTRLEDPQASSLCIQVQITSLEEQFLYCSAIEWTFLQWVKHLALSWSENCLPSSCMEKRNNNVGIVKLHDVTSWTGVCKTRSTFSCCSIWWLCVQYLVCPCIVFRYLRCVLTYGHFLVQTKFESLVFINFWNNNCEVMQISHADYCDKQKRINWNTNMRI